MRRLWEKFKSEWLTASTLNLVLLIGGVIFIDKNNTWVGILGGAMLGLFAGRVTR